MTEKNIPSDRRQTIFEQSRFRLERMAIDELYAGRTHDDVVAIAIDLQDPSWAELSHVFYSDEEIQQRVLENKTIGILVANSVLLDILCENFPQDSLSFMQQLPEDKVRAFVFADHGLTMYAINPDRHYELN